MFVIEKLSGGGAERVTSLLAGEMSTLDGYDTYICEFIQGNDEYQIPDSVKKYSKNYVLENKWIECLNQFLFLRRIIRKVKPDYVISLGMFSTCILLAMVHKSSKFKLVLSERSDPTRIPRKKIFRMLRNWAYFNADGLVLQTQYVKSLLPQNCVNKATVIPNPVIVNNANKNIKKEKVIINCSRLIECKNLRLLIDAFSEVHKRKKEFELHILGEGKLREELLDFAKSKGVGNEVKIYPFNNNVSDEINRSSIYVSTSNFEGMSNSVLEALSMGVPTIVTDCPVHSMRDIIINNVSGIFVPVNSKNELVNAMLNVLDDEKFAKNLGDNGRKIVEKLNLKNITESWVKYLQEI